MEVLHHLADAIAALTKAYDVETDEMVAVHIRAAQASAFRAVRAVAEGQVDDGPVLDWTEEVKIENRLS
jgi:hypothetical protein